MKKILLFIFTFLSFFSIAYADVNYENITDDLLNSLSSNIYYTNNSISIVKGNISEYLYVSDIINNIDINSLLGYGVDSVNITFNDGNVADSDEIIKSGMEILFTLSDDTQKKYEIVYVGDINDDGIINNLDVEDILNEYKDDNDVDRVNDINNDGLFNLLDVTSLYRIVSNSSWDIINSSHDNLYNELSSQDSAYVGDEIEVKYSIKGFDLDSLVGIEGIINYDDSLLELTSVDINSNYGSVDDNGKFMYLFDEYNGDSTLITFKFKALKAGNALVSIDSINASVGCELAKLDSNNINTSINIIEKNEEDVNDDSSDVVDNNNNNNNSEVLPTKTDNVTTSNNNVSLVKPMNSYITYGYVREGVTYIHLSSINSIDMLRIKNYTIDFNKDILEYNIDVDSNVDSLNLDIILSSNLASYEVIGNEKFKTGKNVVKVIVTAEDGSTKTYIINVNKKAEIKEKNDKTSNSSKIVIVILLVLIIIGLIYIIFKEDEE